MFSLFKATRGTLPGGSFSNSWLIGPIGALREVWSVTA